MSEKKGEMTVEGKRAKRYGISYGGETVGSWDAAKEALEGYRKYEQLIRPVTDRKKKFRYGARDGRKEISMEELRLRARQEAGATPRGRSPKRAARRSRSGP